MDKKEKLAQAIKQFEKDGKYLPLFIVVRNVTSQGSGLVWSDVSKVIEEVKAQR